MINLDRELCIGCGTCADICPEVFKLTDNKAEVLNQDDTLCAKNAEEVCPVQAIKVE